MINQALISVSNKVGILEFTRVLSTMGIQILSTGGTATLLINNNIQVTKIADYINFPEILNGRVKTLHPKIYAGILARRNFSTDIETLEKYDITLIDMVVVNLYPFQKTITEPQCLLEDAIENIDIGGSSILRSSAKNYKNVIVICDPADYDLVLTNLRNHGNLDYKKRFSLAQKAFTYTAKYDEAIANYFRSFNEDKKYFTNNTYPKILNLQFQKIQEMRYGENPHQSAAFYRDINHTDGDLVNYTKLQGKQLSFNNITDVDAALKCITAFDATNTIVCIIIKHANPCGAAIGKNALEAYKKAFQTDPISAFGSIIAFNCELDVETAQLISKQFTEVLVATEFSIDALKVLANKQNVRLLKISLNQNLNTYHFKQINGGLLVQSPDTKNILLSETKLVSEKKPTEEQLQNLIFAWRIVKFVKSNAIVFCNNKMTLGIGAGQMNRIDSARIAIFKAQNASLSLIDSVVASDAFFPFRDSLDIIINAGANCVIHPGGSIRDQEVINAANEHKIVMLLTNVRHFCH